MILCQITHLGNRAHLFPLREIDKVTKKTAIFKHIISRETSYYIIQG